MRYKCMLIFLFFLNVLAYSESTAVLDSTIVMLNVEKMARYSNNVVANFDTITLLFDKTNKIVKCINRIYNTSYTFYVVYEEEAYFGCYYSGQLGKSAQQDSSNTVFIDDDVQVWLNKKSLTIAKIIFGG